MKAGVSGCAASRAFASASPWVIAEISASVSYPAAGAAAARRGVPVNSGSHLVQLHTVDAAIPRFAVLCNGLHVAPVLLGYPHPVAYLLA